MGKYLIVIERISEVEVVVEAEDEDDAIIKAISGEGESEDTLEFAPAIIFTKELEPDGV